MQKLLLGFFFLAIFIFFIYPMDSDGDFFQHANIGKFVIENKSLPYFDTLTFTAQGKEYIGYSWATGIIFYSLYETFGPIAINLFMASIALITFLLLYALLWKITSSTKSALMTIFLVAPVVSTRWPSRPEIITYPFIIAILLINEYRKTHPRLVIFFPILILFWANFYGVSTILGLILLLLFALVQWLKDKGKFSSSSYLFYLSVVASFPLALLNGYGTDSLFFISLIPKMTGFHGDWAGVLKTLQNAPPEYLAIFRYRLLIYLLYISSLVILLVISLKKIRSSFFYFLLALALLVPFFAIRQIPLAAILSTPFLAALLSQKIKFQKIVLGVIIFLGAISLITAFRTNSPGFGEDHNTFPKEMVYFLKENQISGRAFNTQRVGSFLSYHLYPDILTFSDTRDELFIGTGVLEEMGKTLKLGGNLTSLLSKHNISVVIADLTESKTYQRLFYSKDWAPVFLTGNYAIFLPSPKSSNLLKRHE